MVLGEISQRKALPYIIITHMQSLKVRRSLCGSEVEDLDKVSEKMQGQSLTLMRA